MPSPPEKAVPRSLGLFSRKASFSVYTRSMHLEILADEVAPALLAQGIPQAHAGVIGARAEAEATHNATLSRWSAYQVATAYLTREVQVNPDRERFFERAAAGALLFPTKQGTPDCREDPRPATGG